MKKITILTIIFGVLFAACFKTEVAPVLTFDGKANMTIAEFQQLHELSADTPPTLIDTAVIITGIITSTDQYGSCYKEIFFQDSTGGLSIRINNSSYYAKYRIGQRIFVKAKGLYLGNYISGSRYGFYQLGLFGNVEGGLEYISSQKENQHIFRHDVPGKPPAPKIITNTGDIVTGAGGDYHTLVKLVNCSFTQANGTIKYFEPSGTSTTISRNVQLSGGGIVEARISAYCAFANDILPKETLNITGLLTMFGTTSQIIIRSIDDVEAPKTLKVFDMTTDPFLQEWTNKQITGSDAWTYNSGNKYVGIQNPSGNEAECWLISPKFNFTGEKDIALYLTSRLINGANENAKVLYTIDGTNWNALEFAPTSTFVETKLKLDDKIAANPNLQVAFQYKTTDKFPWWLISNITFKANVY
jgi:DNA/RNA endonuclease YhcR with UshA esterase domain